MTEPTDRSPANRNQRPLPEPDRRSILDISRVTPSEESRKIALLAAQAGLNKKASAVDIIDVTGKVDYADFLVLMTGQNARHVSAIADEVDCVLGKGGVDAVSVEGLPAAKWVLVDFVDVVVHFFQSDDRVLYDLDGLWMDADRVEVQDRGQAGDSEPVSD